MRFQTVKFNMIEQMRNQIQIERCRFIVVSLLSELLSCYMCVIRNVSMLYIAGRGS